MYPAIAIADYFLLQSWSEGRGLSPMQIQKLVYFAHGWHLGIFDKPLITDRVEAWDYGPVIPSLYQAFKKYGSDVIRQGEYLPGSQRVDPDDERAIVLLRRIWEVYGGKTGLELSSLTHVTDGPWLTTRLKEMGQSGRIPRGIVIPNKVLKNYFERRLQRSTR